MQDTFRYVSFRYGTNSGPPFDRAVTDRIIHATSQLLAELGYELLSIERVAKKARCGKTAIYRRYASKPVLVAATVLSQSEEHEPSDTGNLLIDLLNLSLVNQHSAQLLTGEPSDAFGFTAAFEPRVFDILWDQLFHLRHAHGVAIVRHGVETSQISPSVDADAMVDAIAGFTLFHQTIKHRCIPVNQYRDVITALVAHPPLLERT